MAKDPVEKLGAAGDKVGAMLLTSLAVSADDDLEKLLARKVRADDLGVAELRKLREIVQALSGCLLQSGTTARTHLDEVLALVSGEPAADAVSERDDEPERLGAPTAPSTADASAPSPPSPGQAPGPLPGETPGPSPPMAPEAPGAEEPAPSPGPAPSPPKPGSPWAAAAGPPSPGTPAAPSPAAPAAPPGPATASPAVESPSTVGPHPPVPATAPPAATTPPNPPPRQAAGSRSTEAVPAMTNPDPKVAGAPLPFRESAEASPPQPAVSEDVHENDPDDDPLAGTLMHDPAPKAYPRATPFDPEPQGASVEGQAATPGALPPHLSAMSIEAYAALAAETTLSPQRTEEVHKRAGIQSQQERDALDALWRARLAEDPQLVQQYRWQYARYEEWLRSQSG